MGLREDVGALYQSQRRYAFRRGLGTDLAAAAPTNVNLFRITGGPINLIGVMGHVAVLIGNVGATTIQLQLTGTLGAITAPICTASGAINTNPVDTVYTITGAVGVGMTIQTGAARGVGVYKLTNEQVLVPGDIVLTVAVSANTGIINWHLSYVPLSADVLVTPL